MSLPFSVDLLWISATFPMNCTINTLIYALLICKCNTIQDGNGLNEGAGARREERKRFSMQIACDAGQIISGR